MAWSGAIQPKRGASEGRPVIAADTSTWVAFLQGDKGADVELLDLALRDQQVVMPPVVLTELLSDPKLLPGVAKTLCEVPLIETDAGYWQRAGHLRGRVLASRRKARLGDALIAQSCVDRGIPLVTRDRDFKAFAAAADLDMLAS
jgi:predicted nucleic acid-binding protein